jgi:hypothetical protein
MPSSALPAWPNGFVDGFGRPLALAVAAFAAGLFAFSFTTFFEAAFEAALLLPFGAFA